MNIKKIFLFLSSFLINYNIMGQNDIIKMDMKKYEIISFDDLVEDISCTKLDKTLFFDCYNMIPYKGHLYFLGSTIAGKGIYIYDNFGKFVNEITFSDALLVNSVSIVPHLEELWVVSRFKIINKFKLDGTLVNRMSLPFTCAYTMPVDKENYLVYSGGGCEEQRCIEGHFMALTDFKSIKNLFIPKWGKKRTPSAAYNLYASDKNFDNIFIFPSLFDTIYTYDPTHKEIKPYYALDFHGDFLTKENYTEDNDRELSEIITKRKYIYSHNSFYQASNKLFFKLKGKREDLCVIDLKSNSLYSCDRLFDNFRSRFLNPIIGSNGENIYLLVWEKDLFEHYQNIKCSYPSIKKILPSLSADSRDWVLVTIKIKK